MSGHPIAAISAVAMSGPIDGVSPGTLIPQQSSAPVSFSQLVFDGVDKVSQQAVDADAAVKAFILDDTVPTHRVMYALEQSQLSLQMMLQVRNRLVEGFQEIMRMQL